MFSDLSNNAIKSKYLNSVSKQASNVSVMSQTYDIGQACICLDLSDLVFQAVKGKLKVTIKCHHSFPSLLFVSSHCPKTGTQKTDLSACIYSCDTNVGYLSKKYESAGSHRKQQKQIRV